MKKKKPSFFERITGSLLTEEEYEDDVYEDDDFEDDIGRRDTNNTVPQGFMTPQNRELDDVPLAIDMYQTEDAIVVRANVAGIPLDDIDVRITRENITLRGSHREEMMGFVFPQLTSP